MPQDYDWSEFIPPERAVELAGKWKHGYIPLDAAALSEKMHGRTGGKKWWSGDGKAVGVSKTHPRPSKQHEGMNDREVRQAYLKAPKGSEEKKTHGAEQERRFNAQAKRDLMAGRDRLNALGIDAHGNKAKSRRLLTTKEVPSAGFKKRPREGSTKSYQRGKISSMNETPTQSARALYDEQGTKGVNAKMAQLRAKGDLSQQDKDLYEALRGVARNPPKKPLPAADMPKTGVGQRLLARKIGRANAVQEKAKKGSGKGKA